MKLRQYQIETVRNLRKEITKPLNQRVILCAPTGAGKTVMFSDVIQRAEERGTKTLVLTDRIELFEQTIRSVGIVVQEMSQKQKPEDFNPDALVTVAMVETYSRRSPEGYDPKLIICDEAHKQTFNKIFEMHPDSLVIGATATPIGKHLFKYYDSIVSSIDIPDLVERGFLLPYRGFQMADDFSDLKVRAGEYTNKSLFNHFNKRKLYSGVVEKWKELGSDRKTICFCVNIEHTIETSEEFKRNGIRSDYVTSKTSKEERRRILSDFKEGKIQVLVNCGILTTGYDEPSIGCVIVNRKTKSLSLWLQMVGRGSRPFEGLSDFIVLDFGQNHEEHGMWNEPREWKLEAPKKKKIGASPVKECKKCYAMNFASARICIGCSHPFPEPKPEENPEGVMVEVTKRIPDQLKGKHIKDLNIRELIILQRSKRYKPSFIWRVLTHFPADHVRYYAEQMGYSKGWIWRQSQKPKQPFQNYLLN